MQAVLNPVGVNCLRAFSGRGIRVWGARTLCTETAWTYVNVRRLLLTAARWIEVNLADRSFEPNDETLRSGRVFRRELAAYFTELHRRGALRGATARGGVLRPLRRRDNAGRRARGRSSRRSGWRRALPNEFVVVHVIHEAGGVSVVGPPGPA